MWSQVTLPLWAVALVVLLAALAVIDRILVPSVRWALRRRANRAIDELNTRLKLRIQPFKLTKRQVLIDRLAFDPEVLHAADEYARETGVPREVALEKVKRYASEIVPSFSAYAYFRVGTRPRDVVFIPVAVNYDRVLEDRMLTGAANTEAGKKPVFGFDPLVFASHVFHHIWMAIRGEWHRFGYTCVSFGEPVSLRKYVTGRNIDFRTLAPEPRHAEIEKFGTTRMDAVGRVVPVLPVSLIATVMLEADDNARSLLEIKERVSNLIGELESQGTYVHIPRADRDYAIAVGLRMLTLRHLVLETDGSFRANPKELVLLKYYANAIAHLFRRAA